MSKKKTDDENIITLDSRVISATGSINFREFSKEDLPMLIERLENQLKALCFVENYYLIAHDETNTPHIHYVIELSGQKRLKTLLNDFEKLGYNREAVNIQKLGFLGATLRYFLHQDEDSIKEGKKQYRIENIVSNFGYEFLEDLISLEDDNLTTDRLIQICLDCNGYIIDIMRRLGLKTFKSYRNEIKMILDYEYSLRFAREQERKRREDESMKELPF